MCFPSTLLLSNTVYFCCKNRPSLKVERISQVALSVHALLEFHRKYLRQFSELAALPWQPIISIIYLFLTYPGGKIAVMIGI